MIVRPHLHWFRLLFVWRGSVLPYIVTRLLLVSAVSVLSVLGRGWWMRIHPESALSIPPFTLMGIALAIFLGFRNSVSYERFWEARKQWGALLIGARSLTREIVSFAPGQTELHRRFTRLLVAFVFALKHQLRGTDPRAELAGRLDAATLERVCAARFGPSLLLLRLAEELAAARQAGLISDIQQHSMDRNLNLLTEASGACERIANTPIPYTYQVLMNRTVMIYCLALPVGLATTIGWLTVLIGPFIAYTYLALDVIGEQIEEPFGEEPNDLALDAMCHGIELTVCELTGDAPVGTPPPVVDYVLT